MPPMIPEDFWLRIMLGCLVIIGVWKVFRPTMLLGEIGDALYSRLPAWVFKPTIGCPPCMASFHGTWLWFGLGGAWQWWPIYVLSLCGMMTLITVEFLNRDG